MHKQFDFPVAAHSYFRVTNKDEQRALFLAEDDYIPTFTYAPQFNAVALQKRLDDLESDSGSVGTAQEMKLVQVAEELQRSSAKDIVAHFKKLNSELYGEPKAEYAQAILHHIRDRAAGIDKYWTYISDHVDLASQRPSDLGPSPDFFKVVRAYLACYAPWLMNENYVDVSLPTLLSRALKNTGLDKIGWTVRLQDNAWPARINRAKKYITIGREYAPRTARAPLRITVHEIYGHASRDVCGISPAESEGFAILLEQLLGERFVWRRSYRYLAASLGWGTLGKPMNFKEVFEILWRAMVILSKYSPDVAKQHAFDECVRVFRGGRPDTAGAIFLKDTTYFAGNIAVWRELEKQKVTYEDFVHIMKGSRGIL